MAKIGSTTLTLGLAIVVTGMIGASAPGCSSDDAAKLSKGGASSGGSSGNASSGGAGGDGGTTNPGGPPAEEVAFRKIEADFDKKCGGACHQMATYVPTPPAFLAPPDAYKSIKAEPGAIVADYYMSSLLQKGPHAGPAVGADPVFEAELIDWLKIESAVIQAQKKPTTDPVSLVAGPNDIDMTKACVGGLTGVHLKFTASLVSGILSLNGMQVVAGAGTDVHVYQPAFIRVLAKPNADMQTEITDPAETFSNTDQTVPGGATTTLAPGEALFAAPSWVPFDFASDKIRIEVAKLEPGKVTVIQAAATCKDVAGFTANVLPSMRGAAGGFNLNCSSCHGAGLAGMSLNGADQTVVCNQVLGKLDTTDITKSLIISKVITGPHNGGTINNAAGWTAVWTANKAVFF